jgi:hypothetical protein
LNIGLGPSRRWGWSSEVSTPHPHPHPHPPPKNNSESMTNAKKKKKDKSLGQKENFTQLGALIQSWSPSLAPVVHHYLQPSKFHRGASKSYLHDEGAYSNQAGINTYDPLCFLSRRHPFFLWTMWYKFTLCLRSKRQEECKSWERHYVGDFRSGKVLKWKVLDRIGISVGRVGSSG